MHEERPDLPELEEVRWNGDKDGNMPPLAVAVTAAFLVCGLLVHMQVADPHTVPNTASTHQT